MSSHALQWMRRQAQASQEGAAIFIEKLLSCLRSRVSEGFCFSDVAEDEARRPISALG
jgi:hypothetical protein